MDIHRHPGQLGPGGSQKYTMYPWISRDIPWMPCWFAVLYMYMYFGYTMYPWISRVVQWMPCWFALLYMFLNERREGRKKEASKVKQKNKAKQHSTPKAMYMYFGYTLYPWISRCSMDALLVCTTVHVHVLRIYNVSMDIQSCSMDALLVCTTVHVHVCVYMYIHVHVVVAELHGLCN